MCHHPAFFYAKIDLLNHDRDGRRKIEHFHFDANDSAFATPRTFVPHITAVFVRSVPTV